MDRDATRLRARGLLVALALASATCVEPMQSGGVVVFGGAERRLGVLCRFRHGDVGGGGVCVTQGEAAPPARVRRIAAREAPLSGPLAAGRPGDYLLENDEIAIVIDQLGRGAGFAEGGGNIVDAADARVRRDELGQMFTYFGEFPRQAVYDALTTGVDAEGAAWIEVRGRELYDPSLAVTTRYVLRPGDRAVLLATTLENTGDRPVEGLELGDAVQWGGAEKVAPGHAPGFRGDCDVDYVAGIGASAAYALISATGEPLAGKNGTAWSNVSFQRDVAIAPGQRARYERVLAVAPRGDSLGVATELLYLRGGAPGGVQVELVGAAGEALPPISGRATLTPLGAGGARSTAASRAAARPGEIALWLRADGAGPLAAEAPPGRYLVGFEGSGRRALREVPVEIRAGEVTAARVALSEAGRLRLSVRERGASGGPGAPTPAKVQLFDAATGAPASPPLPTITGELQIPLPPGRFRVVASRGPELSLAEATVDIGPAADTILELSIARVVDTSGYVGCDLHQHTALSADAGVSAADRVVSNVIEGVECAVASEHNVIADLSPIVRELGVASRFRSIAGEEVTSDASRAPFGHINAFPLEVDPSDARGGAVRVRDRTAKDVFDDLLALPGERVLQVNHPRSGRNGYFDQLRFDPATGVGAAPGYDARFDAIEVWGGRDVARRARVLDDLWALLRASRPVTPTANTDTHGLVGAEAGYPRTYLGVAGDDPARLATADVVAALRRSRDVVLTNGPFVTVRAGDVRQGGLASVRPSLSLTIRVERAPWVDADELTLWVGGVPSATIPLPGGRTTAAGAVVDEVVAPVIAGRGPVPRPGAGAGQPIAAPPIRVVEDTFVVAVVQGRRPLEPVLSGDPDEIRPFAMTAPLWLDADGDGRALGR